VSTNHAIIEYRGDMHGWVFRCPLCNAWDKSWEGSKPQWVHCDECGAAVKLTVSPETPILKFKEPIKW